MDITITTHILVQHQTIRLTPKTDIKTNRPIINYKISPIRKEKHLPNMLSQPYINLLIHVGE